MSTISHKQPNTVVAAACRALAAPSGARRAGSAPLGVPGTSARRAARARTARGSETPALAVANPRQGRAAARAPVPLLKRFQPGTRRRRCREHRACEPGQTQGSGSDSRHRRDGAATDTATGRKGARGVCGGKAAARGAGLRDTAWGTIRLRGGRQGRQEAGGLAPRCQGRPAVRLTPRDNRETLPPGPGSPYSPRAAGRHPESPCSTLSGPLLPLSGPSHCLPRAGPVRQRGVPATHSSGEAQTPAGLSPSGARNGCRAGDRASCDRKRAEAALAGASRARQPEGIHF